jgi:tryptophan-rich sensory protein
MAQDALSDAEEYLRNAYAEMLGSRPGIPESEALASIVKEYGAPDEVAAAYRQIESRTRPTLAAPEHAESGTAPAPPQAAVKDTRPVLARFFGVFAEPRAWGALFYLLFTLVTGIFYFTWVVTGLSLSLGLLVLIIGLPLAALFLLSVKGIALVEGRLVEALLGVRMPRRQRFSGRTGLWQRFKNLLADKHTWFSMVYMLLQMPLGIIYFTVFVTLVATSLGFIFWPIVAVAVGIPIMQVNSQAYYATGWLIPVSVIAGGLLLTATMHLARALGKAHGALAKAMLVRL